MTLATTATAPSATVAGALPRAVAPGNADPRVAMATPDLKRFAGLMAQLGLLLAVFYLYGIEEPTFAEAQGTNPLSWSHARGIPPILAARLRVP